MISGDILQRKSSRVVAGSLAVMLLGSACGAERTNGTATTNPNMTSSSEGTTTTTAPTTTTTKKFTPIVGSVAHTENAQGVKEGVFTTRGGGDEAKDREVVRLLPEGATVQVLCHFVGREIDLRAQSPGLGLDSTTDWLRLNETGQGPEAVPDVFVDTSVDKPVPGC